jgi:hypothetical protein
MPKRLSLCKLSTWRTSRYIHLPCLTASSVLSPCPQLLKLYGANAWRDYNERLEKLRLRLQGEVQEAQKTLDKFNLDRKNEQARAVT